MDSLYTGFRLTSGKAVLELEKWRKLQHANLVTLREMFTTKAFGDNCNQLDTFSLLSLSLPPPPQLLCLSMTTTLVLRVCIADICSREDGLVGYLRSWSGSTLSNLHPCCMWYTHLDLPFAALTAPRSWSQGERGRYGSGSED